MILSLVSFSTDSRIRNADLGRFTAGRIALSESLIA